MLACFIVNLILVSTTCYFLSKFPYISFSSVKGDVYLYTNSHPYCIRLIKHNMKRMSYINVLYKDIIYSDAD